MTCTVLARPPVQGDIWRDGVMHSVNMNVGAGAGQCHNGKSVYLRKAPFALLRRRMRTMRVERLQKFGRLAIKESH